jgi:hypothetical protein
MVEADMIVQSRGVQAVVISIPDITSLVRLDIKHHYTSTEVSCNL